ncbi:hypothetical protein ACHAWO_012590 [Cyclotella atomus]|uniref:Uncharacterized protein n=1 Tax=Cyclotella atomus TaxID=382360 RepID=A0ABD3QCG2_9STRA
MIAPNHHRASNEDASTVQVSDANSLLGSHLIEGDWTEALEHLSTPEGTQDVKANNNPLGLLFAPNNSKQAYYQDIPKTKTSALFAALFVRAPLDIVTKIYEIDPRQFQDDDLAYTLSVIPSEEEERLLTHPRQRIPYRSRAWSIVEYNSILGLLLQHYSMHQTNSGETFLHKCNSWILPFPLTPLCIAAYNSDVLEDTIRTICMLKPRAVDVECKLFGVQTLPFIIAAASPVPPKPSVGVHVSVSKKYNDAKERRWRKVKHLIVGSSGDCYIGNHGDAPSLPEPTADQVCKACDEAIKRNEWELVREFLKRQDEDNVVPVVQDQLDTENINGDGMDVDIPFSPVATAAAAEPLNQVQCIMPPSHMEKFRKALAEHDKKNLARLQKQQKARAKDDWVHKNMGVVMYPIDAVVDVATAIIPRSWRKRHGGDRDVVHAIVSPMS